MIFFSGVYYIKHCSRRGVQRSDVLMPPWAGRQFVPCRPLRGTEWAQPRTSCVWPRLAPVRTVGPTNSVCALTAYLQPCTPPALSRCSANPLSVGPGPTVCSPCHTMPPPNPQPHRAPHLHDAAVGLAPFCSPVAHGSHTSRPEPAAAPCAPPARCCCSPGPFL